jgi:hypothetical protein
MKKCEICTARVLSPVRQGSHNYCSYGCRDQGIERVVAAELPPEFVLEKVQLILESPCPSVRARAPSTSITPTGCGRPWRSRGSRRCPRSAVMRAEKARVVRQCCSTASSAGGDSPGACSAPRGRSLRTSGRQPGLARVNRANHYVTLSKLDWRCSSWDRRGRSTAHA